MVRVGFVFDEGEHEIVGFGCFPGYADFAVRDNWSGGRFLVAEVYGCLSEGGEGSDAAGDCGDLHD